MRSSPFSIYFEITVVLRLVESCSTTPFFLSYQKGNNYVKRYFYGYTLEFQKTKRYTAVLART